MTTPLAQTMRRRALAARFEHNIAINVEPADVDYLSNTWMPLMLKMMEEAVKEKPSKDVLGARLALWLAETEGAPPAARQALQEWRPVAAFSLEPPTAQPRLHACSVIPTSDNVALAELSSVPVTSELEVVGYSVPEPKGATSNLKEARYSATDLKEAGHSLSDLTEAGYRARDLNEAGYSLSDLTKAGYSLSDLKAAGYNMKEAGYRLSDLEATGYRARDLKEASYSATDLRPAGYGAYDLMRAGYGAKDLKEAGYSTEDMTLAGYFLENLMVAGYSYEDLRRAGYFR